jgi:hypothetical protein
MKDPTANNVLVETLGSSLRSGGSALDAVPDLLKRVLKEESWRSFKTRRHDLVEHERFADFVTTEPLAGLGSSVDLVRRIVSGDTEALDLLDRALQNPAHVRADVNNINVSQPRGTSKDYALRKLRKDAPELHADVLAGEISAHAAMVKAGFRHRTFSVPADEPERIASTLRRQLDPDTLSAVVQLLEAN